MKSAGLLSAALFCAAQASAAEVTYVEQSFVVPGEILGVEAHDVDGDGRADLVLAFFESATRRRALAIHPGGPDGRFADVAATTIPVLDDVVAWALCEVRADPGRELLFLTRAGAFASSPTRRGYRGNLETLVRTELLYDVPDPRRLPAWRYVLPHPDGDRLLLPEAGGFRVWGPPPAGSEHAEGTPRYVELGAYFGEAPAPRITGEAPREEARQLLLDAVLDLTGVTPDFAQRFSQRVFLRDGVHTRAPALADVDGDGRPDLLLLRGEELLVFLADAAGDFPREPTRIEILPASLAEEEGGERDIHLVDADGDGKADLLVHLQGRREDGQGNRVHDVVVLHNDGARLVPSVPGDLRRFEAAWAEVQVVDVDGDGRPDLVIEQAVSPSRLELLRATRPAFKSSLLLFRGQPSGRFARKPDLTFQTSIEFADLASAVNRSLLAWDCDGDGVRDLVDVDLHGNVLIRRIQRKKRFFGGETWTLEEAPWKQFRGIGSLRDLQVLDVNGDELGDILTSRRDRVTVLLSRRPEARR